MSDIVAYILGFKPYVLLPLIIFALALVFRVKWQVALKSALSIGVAFVGIFMVFDFFVSIIGPAVKDIVARTGLQVSVLDTGWPPLAGITWQYQLAPVLLLAFLGVNLLMLVARLTKVVDIDIWNYWHVIFLGAMVQAATGQVWLAVACSLASFVLVLKLAEWSAPLVQRFSGMEGICIPHLSAITHFPIALLGDWLIGKVPGLRRLNARPADIQRRIGIAGEPMVLGLALGVGLGVAAGWDFRGTAELAVKFAAVIVILPVVCGILGNALVPVGEGMKQFIGRRFPALGATYIGLDVAVLFGIPSVLVTALLLIPVALAAAFVLPGVNFIPLGDLTNIVVPVSFIALATRGNVVRAFIIGVPVIVGNLYVASNLAGFITGMAHAAAHPVVSLPGTFTSFLDGGQLYRFWVLALARLQPAALALLAPVLASVWLTRRWSKRRAAEAAAAE